MRSAAPSARTGDANAAAERPISSALARPRPCAMRARNILRYVSASRPDAGAPGARTPVRRRRLRTRIGPAPARYPQRMQILP